MYNTIFEKSTYLNIYDLLDRHAKKEKKKVNQFIF